MDKRMMKGHFLFCLMVFCLMFASVPALAADTVSGTQTTQKVKNGVVKEGKYYRCYQKGKLVKNKWITWKKARYYFNAKGRAVAGISMKQNGKVYVFARNGKLLKAKKARMITIGNTTWYVSKEGTASVGWFTVDGKLYYADSKGRLYKNRTRDGIQFSKTGAAKSSTDSELKIVCMDILSRITNSSMTKSQKLSACWSYVIHNISYELYDSDGNSGWQRRLALRTLKRGRGDCSGFACAFAALAYEIGYDPYVICGRVTGTRDGAADGMTSHTWVTIDGLYYDTEAQYAGWMKGIYASGSYPINHTVSSRTRYAG